MAKRRVPLTACATFSIFLFAASIRASFEIAAGDDADLTSFVTRPEIRVPVLNVTKYQSDLVSPGYFFAAPYARIFQEKFPSSYHQPCQTGPQIYDNEGNLVWTGACQFSNKNAADVRPVLVDGEWRISGIHVGLREDDIYQYGTGSRIGYGYVLGNTYSEEFRIQMPKEIETFNMHEFKILETTKTALSILYQPKYVDVSAVEGAEVEAGWVGNMGFRETELATGDTTFEWWALDHVNLTESTKEPEDLNEELPSAWNFL